MADIPNFTSLNIPYSFISSDSLKSFLECGELHGKSWNLAGLSFGIL